MSAKAPPRNWAKHSKTILVLARSGVAEKYDAFVAHLKGKRVGVKFVPNIVN